MPTKDEFYHALERLKDASDEALRNIPEDMHPQSREGKIWRNLLTRLPEQISDLKLTFSDPHRVKDKSNPFDGGAKIIDPFGF
jgi:hypothetical protein